MDVASYRRLNELVTKFSKNMHNEHEYMEIHHILDDAIKRIEEVELTEVLYNDDFQIELERELAKAK